MKIAPLKYPSAWIPVAMSLAALATVLVSVALSASAHEADEETATHLWQILVAGQEPVVAIFALRWLPWTPGQVVAPARCSSPPHPAC